MTTLLFKPWTSIPTYSYLSEDNISCFIKLQTVTLSMCDNVKSCSPFRYYNQRHLITVPCRHYRLSSISWERDINASIIGDRGRLVMGCFQVINLPESWVCSTIHTSLKTYVFERISFWHWIMSSIKLQKGKRTYHLMLKVFRYKFWYGK